MISYVSMRILIKWWPILTMVTIWIIFFYPLWLQNKAPMPADLIVNKWHDYNLGGFEYNIPVKNPLLSDVPSLIYPLKFIAISNLKEGVLPLWNPYMLNGYPLFAEFQTATLNPLNGVFLFLDFVEGWSLQVSLQILLALTFMYFYLRNLEMQKISALFGSIAFSFCGFNLFWMEYNIHTFVAALIPLLLLLVDKYESTKKLIYLVLLSFVLSFQIFGGFPQMTIYTLVLLFVYSGFRKNLKNFLIINFFLVLGLLLSAIQLIPGMELISNSQRIVEAVDPSSRFIKPEQIVNLLVPDYFGNPATYNFWGANDYTSALGYTGAITFALVFLSLLIIRQKEIFFFWGVLVITLLLIIDNPLSRFLTFNITDQLLKGSQVAMANKALVLVSLSLAILGAFGLELIVKNIKFRKTVSLLLIPVTVLAILLIWTYSQTGSNYMVALRNTIVSAVFMVVAIGVIILNYKLKKSKILAFSIVVLLAIELVRYGWKITPFVEKSYVFPTNSVISYLKSEPEPFRIIGGQVIAGNMWVPYNLSSPDGYDSIYPLRTAKFLSAVNDQNAQADPLGKYGSLRNFNSPLVDLMNVKYGLFAEDYRFSDKKYRNVFQDKSVSVLENKDVLPRAFVVTEWEVANTEIVLRGLLDKNFPLDKKIILEEPFEKYPQSGQNSSQVSFVTSNLNTQEIKVKSENPGFLFVSDTYYPGWKAYVDNSPTHIYIADYAFRAIPVDKGEHLVRMSFEPESMRIGLWISLITAIILAVLALISSKKSLKI